jgi:O-succinylbenzoate synthase
LSFRIRLVKIPFLAPFTTSFGTETERRALVLEFEADGVRAFGECVTDEGPYYGYEDNQTALHIIRDHLAPLLRRKPSPGEFIELTERIRGHNMAKAAVEMLLWDYHSKRSGRAVFRALGPTKGHADVGISLGIARTEETMGRVSQAVDRGYKRIKLKISRGREYQIVSSVRDSFPEVELSADANSCYTLKDLPRLRRLDRFGLVYLEQPLGHDDLLDHARLAKELSTSICLDESISSVEKARQALEIGACKVINIKPGRLGGFTNSLKVAKLTRQRGGHVWVGGMLETGVGRSFNVSFGSLRSVDYAGDTSPNDKYFARDIVKNPFKMVRGQIRPNPGPGIGIEIDEAFLSESTEKIWKIF